ncbi:glycosyltransferase family 4 protein [Dothidotthia symphoricarpi CBS 119687]|uniref:Glycosyltransferase family 4 protein n=1 Tax=Dothidotthia symphoricarpi CBS 119687 TaxID=1392245 RepID=A0A6A6A7V7_9PLEO|nr:glycosyltransferase family 4 protein [Dothidotthia symphoricarpi CBS 119687]KAF2127910.1 glycosyltransferase family 4 protein [Dothidotthia symphoricarpi CBS 119687]
MSNILGIQAFGTNLRLWEWWEDALAAVLGASGLLGIIALVYFLWHSISKHLSISKDELVLPPSILERIRLLSHNVNTIRRDHILFPQPTSFGVYLGYLSNPVTEEEAKLLSQWDVIVLDYRATGVLEAVNDENIPLGRQVIARLDLQHLLHSGVVSEDKPLDIVEFIYGVIQQNLRRSNRRRSFTGVLVSEWRGCISTLLLNGLAHLFSAHGLDVYVEIGPPDFLEGAERLDPSTFAGLVVRGGLIAQDGERRDFFEVDKMETTLRAFLSQARQRALTTLMWETVDNEANPSHATIRWAHRWCRYHGAIFHLTSQRALTNVAHISCYKEPLAAFQWLKDRRVMNVHEKFRTASKPARDTSGILRDLLPLQDLFPLLSTTLKDLQTSYHDDDDGDDVSIASMFTWQAPQDNNLTTSLPRESVSTASRSQNWSLYLKSCAGNPTSYSFDGTMYGPFGCFPIGMTVSKADFVDVLQSQRQLRDLQLLDRLPIQELRAAAGILSSYSMRCNQSQDVSPTSRNAIFNLANGLAKATDEVDGTCWLHVYRGLDSGFHTPRKARFWAVWEVDPETNLTTIYVSKNVTNLTEVLLHTYLSASGCSRYQCLLMEYNLNRFPSEPRSPKCLPQRMADDLRLLSPADLLLYLQHLKFSHWGGGGCPLISTIRVECQRLLIDMPTYQQLKNQSNMDYISGTITDGILVKSRLEWYTLHRLETFSQHKAIELFRHIDITFRQLLMRRDRHQLDKITFMIEDLTSKPKIGSTADYILFCIFCAAKKAAFEEIYIEVSDRNKLFNQYSDQSAAFAELFALGSQCEAYFDISPSEMGIILSKKHRDHYNRVEHQPPMQVPKAPIYAPIHTVVQSDIDLDHKSCTVPGYRRFTFLSIFAIPVLIDILLMSTTGHGLFLSAYMTRQQQKYGSIAFLCSLLLSGAIGTWVSIGGTYYLVSSAFSAANMFVLTRLVGGLAFTFAGAVIGFVAISTVESAEAGAVFFFYLFGLTAYFSTLAVLTTYRVPGSNFLAGRKVILMILPVHVISPILTIWISGFDVVIYLCSLFFIVTSLIFGIRRLFAQWAIWQHTIRTPSDAEVKEWFEQCQEAGISPYLKSGSKDVETKTSTLGGSTITTSSKSSSDELGVFQSLSQSAVLTLCREALHHAVMKEKNRRFWQKPTKDIFVKQLADCWDATIFLLDWYGRQTDTKRQLPYSSTWNLTTQVALENMHQSQKGIRMHNSFVHWRIAGDEIGCTVLYFLVILMDRCLTVVQGRQLVGLATALDTKVRLPLGFGLAYYLVGSILLDHNAQRLHILSVQLSPATIENTSQAWKVMTDDLKAKRRLYFTTLCRYIGVHMWVLALFTALNWVFNGSSAGTIMFLAYVGAYSGLLLYQYNTIFSGPNVPLPLLVSVILGYVLGSVLVTVSPEFEYNEVITLAISTWTTALLSLKPAQLRLPVALSVRMRMSEMLAGFKRFMIHTAPNDLDGTRGLASQLGLYQPGREKYHIYGSKLDETSSQSDLWMLFNKMRAIPEEDMFCVLPSNNIGDQVVALLLSNTHERLCGLVAAAFPTMPSLVSRIVQEWKSGSIQVFLVSMQSIEVTGITLRAISRFAEGPLVIYITSDACSPASGHMKIEINCVNIAETMVHAYLESVLGMPHDQARIAELTLTHRSDDNESFATSELCQNSMLSCVSGPDSSALELAYRKELLRNLSFGYDCDIQWNHLSLVARQLILKRCLGATDPCTEVELAWISAKVSAEDSCTALSRVARYDLGAYLAVSDYNRIRCRGNWLGGDKRNIQNISAVQESSSVQYGSVVSVLNNLERYIRSPVAYVYHRIGTWIKLFILANMADAEYQRELKGVLGDTNRALVKSVTFVLTGLWMYSRALMSVTIPFFLYHRRAVIGHIANTVYGSLVIQKKNRLIIRRHETTETAFVRYTGNSSFDLVYFTGELQVMPDREHIRVANYDEDMRMTQCQEFQDGQITSAFAYEYIPQRVHGVMGSSNTMGSRMPVSRLCLRGSDVGATVHYNNKGRIESGSYVKEGNLTRFKYHYRTNARHEDELLRAEIVLSHMSVNVEWCAPPPRHAEKPDRWVPTPFVQNATFVQGADTYECTWLYDHKLHPLISTKLNSELVDTPDMIRYDWLDVLRKPTHCNFTDENPLLRFQSPKSSFLGRLLHTNVKQQKASVSRVRSRLWQAWKERKDLDGVTTRWVDEELIRKDTLLRPYWRRRDRGSLANAKEYLTSHADAIMASSDLTSIISAWTPLAIRASDLFSFTQGGDSVRYTKRETVQDDTNRDLHVLAVDTGTWPNEGGGVSACRRDVINNLGTIKWHMVVESANDFGLPKFQTEKNVESLKVLPLWGIDFMYPNHGIFGNKPDHEIDHLMEKSTVIDVRDNFIPILATLVCGARSINMTPAIASEATRALVNLNAFFEGSRHWREVWTSNVVKDAWRELWLMDDIPNTQPPSEWFRTELPTLTQLDTALELWLRYLYIFSVPLPKKIPHVFQASHHSIWDHAISWRETNLYLSSAMCTLPPFVRNALLGLMKLTSCLVLHHADQILPCADFFNPGWETEIGSARGQLTHRNVFRRKIDPVVNGITDMQKFAPITEIKTKTPTVTMLSHIWFAKDIKTALLAADIITNEWGFKDYQLDIYGALNKSPVYASECQGILASKGLGQNVALRGTADPAVVLADTWVFLNSSVSEGLPLALGEAALTGAPIVCTDVGASRRVLTDPENGACFSEVVAPNDAYGLARAQINLLAMIDHWAQYAEDNIGQPVPVLPHRPSPEDVKIITKRMYEKSNQRRNLGMMARSIVEKSFGGERYLREHEQMLWIGKAYHGMRNRGIDLSTT